MIAEQIRDLDAAATRAADNVADAARRLRAGDSSTQAELTASVGDALVERTAEIRDDCERLAALVTRSAKLLAESEGRQPQLASVPPPKRSIAPSPVPVESPGDEGEPQFDEPSPLSDGSADEVSVDEFRESEPSLSESPTPVPDSDPASGGSSEGVRLIATQMAIAGSSRAEIERRLRVQFGVVDAGTALDDIFGTSRSGGR